jgi:8-oxo-dGTP diphosphatase
MSQEKYRIKSAAYIVPRKGHKVLLSLRKGTGFMDGYYSLVAGHIEENESAEHAAIREASEESGIGLNDDQLTFVYLMHRYNANPDDAYIDVFFEVREWQGEFENMEPEKCGGLDWFDINNLPDNTIPYVADVLTSYQTGERYKSIERQAS